MNRARIAIVVAVFPARSETFITSKALGLVAAGWDVRIVCQRLDATLFAELPPADRETLRGRISAAWPHRPKWFAAMLAPVAMLRCMVRRPVATVRYLARGGTARQLYLDAELICLAPQLIHFEFGALAAGRMETPRRIGAGSVVSFRGYDLNVVGLDDPAHYADVWERADAIHVLGEHLWRRAQERGCPPGKLHALIPPAIDTAVFDPRARSDSDLAGTTDRPFRILSVGRLDWRKGYEFGLEAVRTLLDRGIHCEYRIAGAGEFHTATAYARYQLGLVNAATLLGSRAPAAVREEMEWADVMLHPAVSEGFCNAVLEAQAMRLPVVCTSAGGLPENVVDGETGIIAPPRDPRALADALAQLAGDGALRARMGAAGRARVLECFQLQDQVAAFGGLYELVLGENRVAKDTARRLSLENDGGR